MSFDKTTNICGDCEIVYDYSRTTIQKSEVNRDDNHISVVFISNRAEPNLKYQFDGVITDYKIRKLHLFGKLHSISNVTSDEIIGELVIESNDNANNTQYSCYLLKKPSYGVGEKTELDDLITLIEPEESLKQVEITANSFLPKQDSCIVYNSGTSKVFVYTTPIMVSKDVATVVQDFTSKTTLFSQYAAGYTVVPEAKIKFKDDDDIFIDCNPVDATGEETSYKYNVPINSHLMKESQEKEYMKHMVDFCIFIIFLFVAYAGVPMFYKTVVIDRLIDTGVCRTGSDSCLKRIRTIDFFLSFYTVFNAMLFLVVGLTYSNDIIKYFGIFAFFFYIFATLIVLLNKQNEKFMQKMKGGAMVSIAYPSDPEGKKNYWDGEDIFEFIKQAVKFFVSDCRVIYIVCAALSFFIFLMSMLPIEKFQNNIVNPVNQFVISFIILLFLPFAVSIFKLVTSTVK